MPRDPRNPLGMYILKDGIVHPCPDSLTWGRWLAESPDRIIAVSEYGRFRVSTIFLGLDHNHGWRGPPVLFETMIFDDGGNGSHALHHEQWRYSTLDDAEAGHAMAVKRVKEAIGITEGAQT